VSGTKRASCYSASEKLTEKKELFLKPALGVELYFAEVIQLKQIL
jgi:hypothetical protein